MSRQFTTEAEKALNKAAKFAIRMGQRIVGSEHLLFGLSAAPGVAAKVLKENGMDKERLDIEVVNTAVCRMLSKWSLCRARLRRNWRNFYWQQQRKPGKCS